MQILEGHLLTKPIRSLAFSPGGTKLVSSARRCRTVLWDLTTGGHEIIEATDSFTSAFSPDGTVVVTAKWMGMATWDVVRRERQSFVGDDYRIGFSQLAFFPDGSRLAAGGGWLLLWEVPSVSVSEVGGIFVHKR